jgi:aminoglycoside 2'-N-acetyltransferase I
MRLRRLRTDDLTAVEVVEIRRLLDAAFGDDEEERFTEADWAHSVGGVHFVLDDYGPIVSHASVVERQLHIAGRPFRTGYVEAVATAPDRQGQGFGTTVMRDATTYVDETFELGALGTGEQGFYERLGWRIWAGPSSVRTAEGPRRTPDEDGYIMVLLTPASADVDLGAGISCEWRPGDVW